MKTALLDERGGLRTFAVVLETGDEANGAGDGNSRGMRRPSLRKAATNVVPALDAVTSAAVAATRIATEPASGQGKSAARLTPRSRLL